MEIGQNDNLYESIGYMQKDEPSAGKKQQGGWGIGAAFSKLTGSTAAPTNTIGSSALKATSTNNETASATAKGGLFNRFQSPPPKPQDDDDEEPHSGNFWNNLNSNNTGESESEDERPSNANKHGWTGFLGGTTAADHSMDESDYDTDIAGDGNWKAPIVQGTPKSTSPVVASTPKTRKSQIGAPEKSPRTTPAKPTNNRTLSTEENSESESDAESTAPATKNTEQSTDTAGGLGLGAFLDKGKESALQAELNYMMNPDPDDKSMADMSLVSSGMDPAAQQRLLQQRMDMSFEKSVCTMSLNPIEAETKERRPWRQQKNLRRGSQLGAMPLNAGMLGSMDREADDDDEEDNDDAALYNMSHLGMGMSRIDISHRPLNFGDDQSFAAGTVGFDDVWKDGNATVTTEMPELVRKLSNQTDSDLARKLKQVASKQKPTKKPSLTPKEHVDAKELTSLFANNREGFLDDPTSMFTKGNSSPTLENVSKAQEIPSDSGHSSKSSRGGEKHNHQSTSKGTKNEGKKSKSLASEVIEKSSPRGTGSDKRDSERKHSSRTEKGKVDGESESRSKRGKSRSHGGHHDNSDKESSRKRSSGRPPRTPDGISTDDHRFRISDDDHKKDERRSSRKSDEESGEEPRSRRHKSNDHEDQKLDGSRQSKDHGKSRKRHDDDHKDEKDAENNDDDKRSRRRSTDVDKSDGGRSRRRSKDDNENIKKDAETDADKDDKRRSRRKSRAPRSEDDDSHRKQKDSKKPRSKSGRDTEKLDDDATSATGPKSEVKPWRQPKKEVFRSDSLGETDKHEDSALSSLEARSRAASIKPTPEKKSNSLIRENSKQGSTDTGKTEDTLGSGMDGNSPIQQQSLKRIDSKAKGKRGSILSALGLKKNHHSKLEEDEDANAALLQKSGAETKIGRPSRVAGSNGGVGISLMSSGENKKKSKIPGDDAIEKKGLLGAGEKKSDERIVDRKSETDKKGRRRRSTSVPKSVDKAKESKESRDSKGEKEMDGSKRRHRRSKSVPVRDAVMDDASSRKRTKKSSTDTVKGTRKASSSDKGLSSTEERSQKKSSRDNQDTSLGRKKSAVSEDEKSRKSKRSSTSRIRE